MRDGDEVNRHCGKTAPKDFIDGDSAVELVFHTNPQCLKITKNVAFQLTYLVTLFDHIFGIFNQLLSTQNVN